MIYEMVSSRYVCLLNAMHDQFIVHASRKTIPSNKLMKRLLIADDHRLFAEGVQFMLNYSDDYQIVGIVSDGTAVMPFLVTQPVDLLLLDVQMPHLSGIDVARRVRLELPALPILALSMQTDYESVRAMFDAGANGFCLKSVGRNELLQALDSVSRGEFFLSPDVGAVLAQGTLQSAAPDLSGLLTSREREIVQLLVEGRSNTDVAERLYISPRTVETHRKNIYTKLSIHHVTELTAFALGRKLT
ncbi:response regulator [Spirosoma areae]